MIKVNNVKFDLEQFGDGTLKCKAVSELVSSSLCNSQYHITWAYDNDAELFALISLVRDIQEHDIDYAITLTMPYIPHARQDRNVSGRLFTLKYFAEIINSLNFKQVRVLDPHSDVALALINRIEPNYEVITKSALATILDSMGVHNYSVMYPDNGAAKKYSDLKDSFAENADYIIVGNKHRNKEGRIVSYELMNFQEGIETVILRDDICSFGGTFVAAAKELRARGVKKIIVIVSHCESNILKGEVFNYVDRVITTDSICIVKHPKLTSVEQFRGDN